MLPFFRKIRYKLAKDNQFFKYSRYAIGEIVLVVVGILIALQINNWNEERKEKHAKEGYLNSLIDELKRDTIYLNYYIKATTVETKRLKAIKVRMEKREATFDTVLKLWFSTNTKTPVDFKPLGNKIFKSLTSTGDIKLFTPHEVQSLISFYDFRDLHKSNLDRFGDSSEDFHLLWEEVGVLSKIKQDNLVYEVLSNQIDTVQFYNLMDKYIAHHLHIERNKNNAQDLLIKTKQMIVYTRSLKE